jgi:hypothetical protein
MAAFLKAESAPDSVSSASASLAASMKRLDCLGSSGFFEFFSLNVVFAAFVTGPSILCPLLTGVPQQAALMFQPHRNMTAIGASICCGSLKSILESGNASLQSSYAPSQDKHVGSAVLDRKPDPPENTNLGACHV